MRQLTHTHCTSIRMPHTWHCKIEGMAKKLGVSTSEIYRQAINLYLMKVRFD